MKTPRNKPIGAERIWRAVVHTKMQVAAELRPLLAQHNLTGPQWAVLRTLGDSAGPGLRLRELSRRLRVTEGNVTGLVDRMAESGLLVRDPHPEDRRVIIARLTDEGQRICNEVTPLFYERLEACFAPLSRAQRESLVEALEELVGPEEPAPETYPLQDSCSEEPGKRGQESNEPG